MLAIELAIFEHSMSRTARKYLGLVQLNVYECGVRLTPSRKLKAPDCTVLWPDVGAQEVRIAATIMPRVDRVEVVIVFMVLSWVSVKSFKSLAVFSGDLSPPALGATVLLRRGRSPESGLKVA